MKDKIKITPEQAKEVLAINDSSVHTFLNGSGLLVGADHSLESINDDIDNADWIEITGEQAKAMGHGIAIIPKGAENHGDILFVETDMEKLKKYDKG